MLFRSFLGSYGTRGVGYDVEYLLHEISRELGLTHDWPVAIVGMGNLGQALANYRGFGARGFRIVALVDTDPAMAIATAKFLITLRHGPRHDLHAVAARWAREPDRHIEGGPLLLVQKVRNRATRLLKP